MIYAQEAIEARLTADTVTAALLGGSSTTVLKLADASPWVDVEHVNLTGSGATLANNGDTRRIIDVDTDLDTVTLDRALSVAPAAGNLLNGGFREWVMAPSAAPNDRRLYYVQRGEVAPPQVKLLQADSAASILRCIVLYGETAGVAAGFGAEERWRFRVFSRVNDWATACAARIARLLDGRSGALTIPGRQVFSIEMASTMPELRTDVLIEKTLRGVIVTAKAAA